MSTGGSIEDVRAKYQSGEPLTPAEEQTYMAWMAEEDAASAMSQGPALVATGGQAPTPDAQEVLQAILEAKPGYASYLRSVLALDPARQQDAVRNLSHAQWVPQEYREQLRRLVG